MRDVVASAMVFFLGFECMGRPSACGGVRSTGACRAGGRSAEEDCVASGTPREVVRFLNRAARGSSVAQNREE